MNLTYLCLCPKYGYKVAIMYPLSANDGFSKAVDSALF